MRPLLLLLLLCIGIGCTPATPTVDVVAEAQVLLETDVAFAEVSKAHGAAEAFRQYLAEDGLGFPSGSHVIRGRDTIYERMKATTTGQLLWEPQHAEVALSGDLGYSWGTYTYETPDADGTPNISYGKYVNVWRKQADGSWKVIADIGNPSPPPDA